jgi:MFS family permease
VDRIGGIGVGVAAGWNLATLGAIATRLSVAYGVGLTTIGLLVTVQFLVHMGMQIPGGRTADRFGAKSGSLLGLAFIVAGNAISLPATEISLAFVGRAVVGLGTGFAFIGGSDSTRVSASTPACFAIRCSTGSRPCMRCHSVSASSSATG